MNTQNKIRILIAMDIALYHADLNPILLNHYWQMPKRLRKPVTK